MQAVVNDDASIVVIVRHLSVLRWGMCVDALSGNVGVLRARIKYRCFKYLEIFISISFVGFSYT